jgi:uncharacterized protein (TIGR03086 family)
MSEVSDRYATVARGFSERLEAVPADRWSSPSPCTDWTAREVVVHVVNTHRRVLSSLDKSEPAEIAPAATDGELSGAWGDAHRSISDALNDEARAGQTVGGAFGEQPFSQLVGRLLCADTLIHTWDLARAAGLDERLDASAVAKTTEFLTPIDEAIRRPGGFAPKIEPKPGADAQTQLLNFAGRAV